MSYPGSWFDDEYDSITFANPYLPIVPGSTQGQLGDAAGQHAAAAHRDGQCAAAVAHDPDLRRLGRHPQAK